MDDPLLILNDAIDDLLRLWRWLRSFRRGRATEVHIFLGGISMAKIRDDQPADFTVEWRDAEGADTADLGGAVPTATVDNAQLAVVVMSDPTHGQVTAVAGWDQQPSHIFHITVSANVGGTALAATSEDIEIDPTVAVSEAITVRSNA